MSDHLRREQTAHTPAPGRPGGPGHAPDTGGVPRRWHRWYVRSMELEATPLEVSAPRPRRLGRYIYLLLVLAAMGLGASYLASRVLLYTATGTVGVRRYPLSPASTMTVAQVAVQPGDRVRAGELLVRFSSPELEQELARTRASLAEVEARLRQQLARNGGSVAELQAETASLHAALQSLVQQYADAQSRVQSLRVLVASGAANRGDLEKARENMLAAKAQYEAAAAKLHTDHTRLAQLRKLNGGRSGDEKLFASLRRLHESQRARLQALVLRSPVNGVVAEVAAVKGAVVRAGEPAAVIIPSGDQRSLLYFPPAARARLRVGGTLSVVTAGGVTLAMRIRRIFPSVQDVPTALRDTLNRRRQAVVVLATPLDAKAAAQVAPGTPLTASVPRFGTRWLLAKAWPAVATAVTRLAGGVATGVRIVGASLADATHAAASGIRTTGAAR